MVAATETVATEMQALTPAVRSRAMYERDYVQPTATCIAGSLNPQGLPPNTNNSWSSVNARVWREELPRNGMNQSTADDYFCFHIVTQHGASYPTTATLLLEGLDLPPSAWKSSASSSSGSIMISRLFRGDTNAERINATLYPNGSVAFTDVWDLQSSNVYRLGCELEMLKRVDVPGELCGADARNPDCDFEVDDLARGTNMPVWPETMVALFNTTDPRLWVVHDAADAWQGRHSARINVPDGAPILMNLPTAVDSSWSAGKAAGKYKVRFAARSSPAGVTVSASFNQFAPSGRSEIAGMPNPPAPSQQHTLTGEWTAVEVEVGVAPVAGIPPVQVCKYPLHIWASAAAFPLTGAQVWVDDISIVAAPSA